MPEIRASGNWNENSSAVQQGGAPRFLNGHQPNLIMEPHSPTTPWHMTLIKQEPGDEERNDSGVASSGSDIQSSPGSDSSQDCNNHNFPPTIINTSQGNIPPYITTPNVLTPRTSFQNLNMQPSLHIPTANMQFYANDASNSFPSTSLLPRENNATHEIEDPLRSLQISVERTGLPASSSPKTSEHSGDNRSDIDFDEYEESGISTPKLNSHGKVKTFKCKQCGFVAVTKTDYWAHAKSHIKPEKLLTCPQCPFVTEYKHHLEYHLRNHSGSKPFKCNLCKYTCVNRSMLNSHKKSHSNVYQYRCKDCNYATKYCHSLKLHLRKYSHNPSPVLYPDGTPNPYPIIDVYGTRRGPKTKSVEKQNNTDNSQQSLHNSLTQFMLGGAPQLTMQNNTDNSQQNLQNPLTQFMLGGAPQLALPYGIPFFGNLTNNPFLFPHNLLQMAHNDSTKNDLRVNEENPPSVETSSTSDASTLDVLDLSKRESSTPEQPVRNRRKGRAYKLDITNQQLDDEDTEEEKKEENTRLNQISNQSITDYPPSEEKMETDEGASDKTINNNIRDTCQFCDIKFGDEVLYTMHMGYHGFKEPFTCNMCGEKCVDKVTFFLHIARTSHS